MADDPEPDELLVAAALAGKRAAFARLVARYERPVRAAAARVLRDAHLAEDAAQEAFARAFVGLARLRDPGAFGGWVMSVARRVALRSLRHRRPAAPLSAAAGWAAPAADPPAGPDDRLMDAVMRLPAHERAVVGLRYFAGLTVGQVAAATGRPVGTVTKQLSRAHERLRASLEEDKHVG